MLYKVYVNLCDFRVGVICDTRDKIELHNLIIYLHINGMFQIFLYLVCWFKRRRFSQISPNL